MKQFIYKSIIAVLAIILIYEFTIGKEIKKYSSKIDTLTTKEGRKEFVIYLREEINKGVNKDRYLSPEDAQLLNKFFKKIQKEINEVNN